MSSKAAARSTAVPAPRAAGRYGYIELYRASPIDRISMIRQGIPANEAKRMIADLSIGHGVALKALNLSPATVNKKARQNQPLSADESERVLGVAKLVGQLQAMIEESGDPAGFDAAGWISEWLVAPLPAFGGARPVDLMDTMEGQALVSTTLAQLQSGAYA